MTPGSAFWFGTTTQAAHMHRATRNLAASVLTRYHKSILAARSWRSSVLGLTRSTARKARSWMMQYTHAVFSASL